MEKHRKRMYITSMPRIWHSQLADHAPHLPSPLPYLPVLSWRENRQPGGGIYPASQASGATRAHTGTGLRQTPSPVSRGDSWSEFPGSAQLFLLYYSLTCREIQNPGRTVVWCGFTRVPEILHRTRYQFHPSVPTK